MKKPFTSMWTDIDPATATADQIADCIHHFIALPFMGASFYDVYPDTPPYRHAGVRRDGSAVLKHYFDRNMENQKYHGPSSEFDECLRSLFWWLSLVSDGRRNEAWKILGRENQDPAMAREFYSFDEDWE